MFSKDWLMIVGILILAVLGVSLWFFIKNTPTLSPAPENFLAKNLNQNKHTSKNTQSKFTLPTSQVSGIQIKGNLTLALLGDSMIQTLGDLKILEQNLKELYPNVEFNLLNYGIGATNPSDGLARLSQNSTQIQPDGSQKQLEPLLNLTPDIVVVESFAYNHSNNTPEGITTHYQTIKEIIEKLKSQGTTVLFLVTIAPHQNYAQGAPGILWDENQQKLEAEKIIKYLNAGLNFAKDNNLLLINAFSASLEASGFGKRVYINPDDNIHYSESGIEFVSDLVAAEISKQQVVEKIL